MSDPDDRDMLAAEYALGTLDAAERATVSARLADDPELAQAVREWQRRLSPLSEATPAVNPPPGLFGAIETRLFGQPSALVSARRLRGWQAATVACAALAASLMAWIALAGWPGQPANGRLVAVLQRDPGAPAMVLDVDLRTRRLTVRSVAPASPAGKVLRAVADRSRGRRPASPRHRSAAGRGPGVPRLLRPRRHLGRHLCGDAGTRGRRA